MNDTHQVGQEANETIEEHFTLNVQTTNPTATRAGHKTCVFCGDPAHCSLAIVLSTVGVIPRSQKCSPYL